MTKGRNKIHTITQCALFSALICVLSPFVIPIGAVPISLSLFAVMLTGTVLTPKMALISVVVYIITGGVGVPVFAGFQGGLSSLVGPTGGYIWSYVFVVLLVSCSEKYRFAVRMIFAFASIGVCYLCGTLHYVVLSGTDSIVASVAICVLPFIPFDVIKTVAALTLGEKVRHTLKKQNLI